MIDGAIYNLICYVYEIFYYLATLNIFTEEHYQKIGYLFGLKGFNKVQPTNEEVLNFEY